MPAVLPPRPAVIQWASGAITRTPDTAPNTPHRQATACRDWSATTMSSPSAVSTTVKSEKAERRTPPQRRLEPTSDIDELHRRLAEDPRFNPPTPSPWKRAALIILVVFLFWLGITLRKQMARQPEIIYASRYSKEHKFRPAASPIITERLPDGRLRVRGAQPTFR